MYSNSICVCILSSLETTMGKMVPSEILQLIAQRTIAQVLCATLQQLIFNYTITMMIIMCSGKSPFYSHCIMAVLEWNERCHFEIRHSSTSCISYATAPDHIDLSDVSTIKELISLYFPSDSLSAKVTSIDGAFPRETD